MSCPKHNHACVRCVSSPAALEARRQLGPTFTIHASAQKRPVLIDIQATSRELRSIASRRSSYGIQLAGVEFDAAVNALAGQSDETINAILQGASLNTETRLAVKHAIGFRR